MWYAAYEIIYLPRTWQGKVLKKEEIFDLKRIVLMQKL